MKIKFESEEKLVSAEETQIGRTYRSNGTGCHYLRIEAHTDHLSELRKNWVPFLWLDENSLELTFFANGFQLAELPQFPMKKIAICGDGNVGFHLSPEQWAIYLAKKGKRAYFFEVDYERDKPKYYEASMESLIDCDFYYEVYDNENHSGIPFTSVDILRDDPDLISTIEETTKDEDKNNAAILIVEIPYDVKWEITQDEAGYESIRVWP